MRCFACAALQRELAAEVDSYSLDDAFEMDEEIVDDDVKDVDASFFYYPYFLCSDDFFSFNSI